MICFETVAMGLEFNAELRVIVYFAVKSDHQLLVRWSSAANQRRYPNRQTAMAEKDFRILVDPGAFTIGTTMRKHIDHPFENVALSGSYKSSNAAHC